ncbi:MAG: methyltransferase domain-containing protein [Deltaproteobacteria bacterium]|nr:methyltransferase domain-containing protein [Deltaproteobacteria bacterium]
MSSSNSASISGNPPSPLATAEPWDLVAAGYVAENMVSFEAFAREALRLVPADGTVLDVAAGPGSLTLLAARTARHVFAVDFAPAMLGQLHERAAAAGISNFTTQIADGQALPFPDVQFDAAYSMFGLIFFPDRARGLAEMARVLRPGKRAIVSSWPPSHRVPMFAALFGAMKAELPGSGIGDAPAALGTADDIRAEMGAAGFTQIEVHEHDVVPGTATPADLWRTFSRGGAPAVLMRRRMGEDGFAAFSERIVKRLIDTLGSEPREMKLTAMLGIGTR